jgi:hypothetical protein
MADDKDPKQIDLVKEFEPKTARIKLIDEDYSTVVLKIFLQNYNGDWFKVEKCIDKKDFVKV